MLLAGYWLNFQKEIRSEMVKWEKTLQIDRLSLAKTLLNLRKNGRIPYNNYFCSRKLMWVYLT